jgi:transcriptional regulator with XRE-family HTH domain
MSSGAFLKAQRQRFQMSQEALAKKLGVSQQTVARWETTSVDIPAKYLKDLAVTFGAKVQDFVRSQPSSVVIPLSKARTATSESDEDDEENESSSILYGTAAATFNGEDPAHAPHVYPIANGERIRLLMQLQSAGQDQPLQTWVNFQTLDRRWVFCNSQHLHSLELIGDDVEAAPSYEHDEVYKAARDLAPAGMPNLEDGDSEDSPYTRQMLEKVAELFEELGGSENALDRFECVTCETVDGRRASLLTEDDDLTQLQFALEENDENINSQFVDLYSEGYYRSTFVRLGSLRLIEVPLLRTAELARAEPA